MESLVHVYPVKPRPLQTSERHKTKQNKTLKSGKCNNQNCSHVKKNCVSIVQREVKLDTFKNPENNFHIKLFSGFLKFRASPPTDNPNYSCHIMRSSGQNMPILKHCVGYCVVGYMGNASM